MSIELVREHFKKWNLQDHILEFPVSSATMELAAQAVGCEPARIAKTLSFQLPNVPLQVVTAGDAKTFLDVSLRRFSTVFPACGSSNSAIELTPAELEQYTSNCGWVDVCKGWQDPA